MTDLRTARILLVGLGNLGRRLCDLLPRVEREIEHRYALRLLLVGAADSSGGVYDRAGLDPDVLSALKRSGGNVARLPGLPSSAVRFTSAVELVTHADADLLCEASPVNLRQGAEPGLTHIRVALTRGIHVVTPNKGPLVLAYRELHDLAAQHGVQLRFDGTVAGGLPALYVGQRDLRPDLIQRIEAVPNLSTGYIMNLLSEGKGWDEAIECARQEGTLEADPGFDLEGWDAAAKLVILVNAVMHVSARLEDVQCQGITGVSPERLLSAREEGRVYKLLATAEREPDGRARLKVAPTPLPADHFLARLGPHEMGVVYDTQIYGRQMMAIEELTPLPSAATMLRDILDIYVPAAW